MCSGTHCIHSANKHMYTFSKQAYTGKYIYNREPIEPTENHREPIEPIMKL